MTAVLRNTTRKSGAFLPGAEAPRDMVHRYNGRLRRAGRRSSGEKTKRSGTQIKVRRQVVGARNLLIPVLKE
eukprot:2777510-Rhodomonas_salina.1